jgi:ribosome maturation factor RimP
MTQQNQTNIDRIREIVTPILESMGLELFDLEWTGRGSGSHLRVFIDKAAGITLEECEQASRFIGHALDVADPIPGTYVLEVSSPGLDRPLRKPDDYIRSIGKLVRLKLNRPIRGAWVMTGHLRRFEDDGLEVGTGDGTSVRIALEEIAQARLEVEW